MSFLKTIRYVGILLLLVQVMSCSEVQPPEPSNFYMEVEVDGQIFRQEFLRTTSLESLPIVFGRDKSSFVGQLDGALGTSCLNSCITPYYINAVFDSRLGIKEMEMLEKIMVPSGSYSTHSWYGKEPADDLAPTKVSVSILEVNEKEKTITGSFQGEVYKSYTQAPVKVPIKGSFHAGDIIR